MQSFEQASSMLTVLGGGDVFDFRAIHDTDKGVPAHTFRGTLQQHWSTLTAYNDAGYGIFVCVSELDGEGRKLANVRSHRAHFIDLDKVTAQQNYLAASNAQPAPTFAVQSSPNKFHVYWVVQSYHDNDRFSLVQHKLRQVFDGDERVADPTRVMRLAGTYHKKNPQQPTLVQCWALNGFGQPLTVDALEYALSGVNVISATRERRTDLGDAEKAAPSLEWLQRALDLTDPNRLDRGEWVATMSAMKQAGWTLADEATLYGMFCAWCERYDENDPAENLKQWQSIGETTIGWNYLKRKVPQLVVEKHAPVPPSAPVITDINVPPVAGVAPVAQVIPNAASVVAPAPLDCSGEFLTYLEQKEYFKGCYFVSEVSKIMTPNCEFQNQASFNACYGGKIFIINSNGKTTDEAWKAATRGTEYKIPVVHHTRFLPKANFGDVIKDTLGRAGINVYKPAHVETMEGDPTPFLNHISYMFPHVQDQKILLDYIAHNIKYPGHKIPWAPVIQSMEGVGKGVIKHLMMHCMGDIYFHAPNSKEMAESGSKFNAWMKNKLFILADEIKVDDRRDMIEVLKPMISEERIEIQSKGIDQKTEDNYSNWMFFTNYKDAVPINQNSRRFAIMYSQIQFKNQLMAMGMNDTYFTWLYNWIKGDGAAIMAHYFKYVYHIERGAIPMRAPDTTSLPEVIQNSLGPIERMIKEAVEDGIAGFRNGWVSSIATKRLLAENGQSRVTIGTIEKIITDMGYVRTGRAVKLYMEEDTKSRTTLFHVDGGADVAQYGLSQGYFGG